MLRTAFKTGLVGLSVAAALVVTGTPAQADVERCPVSLNPWIYEVTSRSQSEFTGQRLTGQTSTACTYSGVIVFTSSGGGSVINTSMTFRKRDLTPDGTVTIQPIVVLG